MVQLLKLAAVMGLFASMAGCAVDQPPDGPTAAEKQAAAPVAGADPRNPQPAGTGGWAW